MADLRPLLPHLPNETILDLLVEAASTHPETHAKISAALAAKLAEESRRVVDFSWESKSVWREINITHRKLSGSRQYEEAGEVSNFVLDTVDGIRERCGRFVNPQTRYNGLSVLRKIGKTICLSATDVVGHEVQKEFQRDEAIERAMVEIVSGMGEAERRAIREDCGSEEALWPKLLELEELGEKYYVLRELYKVLELLEGDSYEGEEGEEGDYDDYDGYDEDFMEDEDDSSSDDEEDEQATQPGESSFWIAKPLW
ncbi:hypothetical protein BJX61DRAFT_550097 [Aspergillus egyptiacus]|nr:hypothetical protein BJX61DRAFT_550097 [Aspergillus egyptiacus]